MMVGGQRRFRVCFQRVRSSARSRWLRLKVLRREAGTADSAIVEFIARYKAGGRANELHEPSRFLREGGRWLYVDGNAG
jgi:SEC-C motif-containing protein